MTKTFLLTISALSILTVHSGIAHADDVDNAMKLCTVFQNTGMTSECNVRGFGSYVDVRIDTTGQEANKICWGVVEQVSTMMRFDNPWTLRVFSPFSGDHPLATCKLR